MQSVLHQDLIDEGGESRAVSSRISLLKEAIEVIPADEASEGEADDPSGGDSPTEDDMDPESDSADHSGNAPGGSISKMSEEPVTLGLEGAAT